MIILYLLFNLYVYIFIINSNFNFNTSKFKKKWIICSTIIRIKTADFNLKNLNDWKYGPYNAWEYLKN